MKKTIIALTLITIISLSGCLFQNPESETETPSTETNNNQENNESTESSDDSENTEDSDNEDSENEDDNDNGNDNEDEEDENMETNSTDTVLDYSEETLATAQENGIPVLYFRADWCPTCKALDKELAENIDELPANLYILKIDYDTAKELKDQYQITTQHTLIQLDNNGNEVTRWIGGGIETINSELVQ